MYSNGTVLARSPLSGGRRTLARSLRSLQIYTRIYISRERPLPPPPTLIHPFAFFPAAAIFSAIRFHSSSLPSPLLVVPALLIFSAVIVFTVSFSLPFVRSFVRSRSRTRYQLPANSRPMLILRRDLLIKKVPTVFARRFIARRDG